MSSVEIDSKVFHARANKLFSAWSAAKDSDTAPLPSLDALAIVVGDAEEDVVPKKGVAVQTWLLGYEFPSTVLVLLPDVMAARTRSRY